MAAARSVGPGVLVGNRVQQRVILGDRRRARERQGVGAAVPAHQNEPAIDTAVLNTVDGEFVACHGRAAPVRNLHGGADEKGLVGIDDRHRRRKLDRGAPLKGVGCRP